VIWGRWDQCFRSGFGGIVRNDQGQWISGYYDNCGITTTNMHTKLFTIYHGLHLVWEANISLLICESDSLMVIYLTHQDSAKFHRYGALITKIRAFMSCPWILKFKHTYCEGNACTDSLAKLGSKSQPLLVLLDTCSDFLHVFVTADALGTMLLRL